MTEAPRYWSNNHIRMHLNGLQRTTPSGEIEVSLNGKSWYLLNGHQISKKPLEQPLTPQAEVSISGNGNRSPQEEPQQQVIYQAESPTSS